MNIKKPLATVITILAGIGTILAIAYFIVEINNLKGFAFLPYSPVILFLAVLFALIGNVAVRELIIFINAHRFKKSKNKKEITE